MRILSIAISFMLAITPAVSFSQNLQGDSLNNVFLPGLLKQNPNASIFYNALVATRLSDTLEQYLDPNYPEIEYEWTRQAHLDGSPSAHFNETAYEIGDQADRVVYPEKREFKYTLFVIPDTALANYSDSYCTGGIHNLDELRQYAERVYPEGTGQDDRLRTSSLNKLMSYHILPFWLSYDQLNTRQKEIIGKRLYLDELDVEDFFETLLPHSIMRISTPYDTIRQSNGTISWQPVGIYINRKGTIKTGLEAEGIRIAQDYSEYNLPDGLVNTCLNGGYHYINKFVLYDNETRNNTLNTRMRIMTSTLSPDFINSGARGRLNGATGNRAIDKIVYTYKPGFCKNVEWEEDVTKFFVRYRDRTFGTYYGEEMTVRGFFDITFRLPSVPTDGFYQVRIWNNSLGGASVSAADRGGVLFYTKKENNEFIPCDIPVDLTLNLDDPLVGGDPIDDSALRINGYMRAPDSYTWSYDNTGDPISEDRYCYRKIICEQYMEADSYYYLRLRLIVEDKVFPFNFIEIVPSSVYSDENNPEDSH